MGSVQIGRLASVVFLSILLIGCGGTPESASHSQSTSTTTTTEDGPVHGPYLQLLGMSTDHVEAALGRPAKESEKGGQLYWEYPSRGLTVVIFKQHVFFYVQTQGYITASFQIGDSEEKVVALTGHQLEPSDFDPKAKVGRAYLPEVVLLISVTNGQVSKVQVMPPGRDN